MQQHQQQPTLAPPAPPFPPPPPLQLSSQIHNSGSQQHHNSLHATNNRLHLDAAADNSAGSAFAPKGGGLNNRPITPELNVPVLPQQATPKPKSKMKTINWNKIHPNKVLGKHNIWTMLATSHADSPKDDLDWGEMEGLFCLNNHNTQTMVRGSGGPTTGGCGGGALAGGGRGADAMDGGTAADVRPRKENAEITLLDGKRCLNVNIFLKQFRA